MTPCIGIDNRASALPVEYVEIREKNSFDPAVVGKLRALVRERRIDIVHAHDYKTDALTWWLGAPHAVHPADDGARVDGAQREGALGLLPVRQDG